MAAELAEAVEKVRGWGGGVRKQAGFRVKPWVGTGINGRLGAGGQAQYYMTVAGVLIRVADGLRVSCSALHPPNVITMP